MLGFIKKIFGTKNDRMIKRIENLDPAGLCVRGSIRGHVG